MRSNSKNKFAAIIADLEKGLRAGHVDSIRHTILKITKRKVPRDIRLSLADLARRAQLPDISVRLLNPIVRPPKGTLITATEEERAEYAGGLIKLGATHEAKELLETLNFEKCPKAQLYLAFAHVSHWDYAASIPLLEQFVSRTHIDDSQRIIARANLAAAYVHQRDQTKAIPLLEALTQELQERSYGLLLSNLYVCWAELEIESGRFSVGHQLLERAASFLNERTGLNSFFISKLKVIAQFLENPTDTKAIESLLNFRLAAEKANHWETVRDCDRYLALHTKNEELLLHLHFGTPYDAFRERLMQDWNEPLGLPETYEWKLHSGSAPKVVDLFGSGNESAELKEGQLLYRFAAILSSDFYRPFRLEEIHAKLFPKEFYNPDTSPHKVHQCIYRMRAWLSEHQPALKLEEINQSYRLKAKKSVTLRVPQRNVQKTTFELSLENLAFKFFGDFSKDEAARFLGISSTWAYYIIREGISRGLIIKNGKSSATRYRFNHSEPLAQAA